MRIEADPFAQLRVVDRGLKRAPASDLTTLPTSAHVTQALGLASYDASPWDRSTLRFRNRAEGWRPLPGPRLHNRVHVWVGGDMAPATSPNDPVFYLNHCNVTELIDEIGFDAVDAGTLAEGGRKHQPGSPAYTEGRRTEDLRAILLAESGRASRRLHLVLKVE